MRAFKTVQKFAVVTIALFFAACSSDSDGGGGGTSGFYMKAKIDGDNFSSSSFVECVATVAGGTLNIQSSDNSGNAFQIQVPNYTGEGTYTSGNNDITMGYINFMDMGATIGDFTSYTSVRGDGQVIITAVTDTQIEGTFTATAVENVDGSTNDVEITDGEFRAEIQ